MINVVSVHLVVCLRTSVRDDAMSNTPSRDGAMFMTTDVPCAMSEIYELTWKGQN